MNQPLSASPPPPDLTPGRVLIVDDEPAVCRVVQHMLLKVGHDVSTAESVGDAVTQLTEQPFDVALVDLDMPDRNGLQLLDEIAARKLDLHAILLTGTADVQTAVGGMKRGAFDYLPKPPDALAVRWCVERALAAVRSRRRERLLRSLADEWSATFDSSPNYLFVFDQCGSILRANQTVLRAIGKSWAEVAAQRVDFAVPGPLGFAVAEGVARLLQGQECYTLKFFDDTLGKHLYLTVSRIVSKAGNPNGVIAVARDVTDLIRAEEAQAVLYRNLLTAQEAERGRLSRELHDGAAQQLVSIALGLELVAAAVPDAAVQARLGELGRMAIRTLEDLRRIAYGLRPAVLDDLGLVPALDRLVGEFTRHTGIITHLLAPTPVQTRLTSEVEVTLYRITQEALANVAKHAGAKGVDVLLEATAGAVRLSITDDGTGVPPAAAGHAGQGLTDMRERAEMVFGSVHLDSAAGAGTTVRVVVPVRGDAS